MAKQVKFRRGTTAQTNAFTGALGEVTVDTDKDTVVIHDGSTVGGMSGAAVALADGTITLKTRSGTQVMTLDGAGNAAILGASSIGGALTVGGGLTAGGLISTAANTTVGVGSAGGSTSLNVQTGSSGAAAMATLIRQGSYAINFGLDTDNVYRIGGYSDGINTYRMELTPGGLATFRGGVTSNNVPAATPSTTALGYLGAPQNPQAAAYTFTMADIGKHLLHTGTAATYTIPSNAAVPMPIGAILMVINGPGAGVLTINITTDTLWRGDGTAGSGTRNVNGYAIIMLVKISATEWMISGAFS